MGSWRQNANCKRCNEQRTWHATSTAFFFFLHSFRLLNDFIIFTSLSWLQSLACWNGAGHCVRVGMKLNHIVCCGMCRRASVGSQKVIMGDASESERSHAHCTCDHFGMHATDVRLTLAMPHSFGLVLWTRYVVALPRCHNEAMKPIELQQRLYVSFVCISARRFCFVFSVHGYWLLVRLPLGQCVTREMNGGAGKMRFSSRLAHYLRSRGAYC